MNAGWPWIEWEWQYADVIHYDWHSGLFEFDMTGVVRFGHDGTGFSSWIHAFIRLAAA